MCLKVCFFLKFCTCTRNGSFGVFWVKTPLWIKETKLFENGDVLWHWGQLLQRKNVDS